MIEKTDTAPEKTDGDEARAVTERSSAPLWTLREEIDDLFEDFFAGNRFGPFRGRRFGWPRQRAGSGFSWGMPTVDVIDKQDAVKICAELPGMAEDDIDVHVTDSALVLSGEKRRSAKKVTRKASDISPNAATALSAGPLPFPKASITTRSKPNSKMVC